MIFQEMNGNGFWKNIMIAMILVLAVEEIIVIQAHIVQQLTEVTIAQQKATTVLASVQLSM